MAAVPELGRAAGVDRSVAPEAAATQLLYEQYARRIYGFCYQQLGSREEAEDAVQTTFMNAFRGLSRGISPEAEAAWLYKIAHNVCLSRRRAAGRRGRVETPGDIQALQDFVAAPQRMGTDELIELQEALASMPAKQRKAILLREWRGLSYREIAGELGLTRAAVETLIFRARRSLARGLGASPEEHGRVWRRLRQGMDVGSVLGILKTVMSGGFAAKAVATAAAVTTTAVVTAVPGDERVPRRAQLQAAVPAVQVAEPAAEASVPAAVPAAPAVAEPRPAPVVAATPKAAPSARKPRAPKVATVASVPPPVVDAAPPVEDPPPAAPGPAAAPTHGRKADAPANGDKPAAPRKPSVAATPRGADKKEKPEKPRKAGKAEPAPVKAPVEEPVAQEPPGRGNGNEHGNGNPGGPPAEPGKGKGNASKG